jgi:hypothetical protein
MYLGKYEEITGITTAEDDRAKMTASCARAKRNLESLLGFTLDKDLVNTNQYAETGKTQSTFPFPIFDGSYTLDPADAVVYAYRLFSYNDKDEYLSIDPCTVINKVKLVKDGITFATFDPNYYRAHYKNGLIKYVQLVKPWICWHTVDFLHYCQYMQLAVDANWLWPDNDTIPEDLISVWADMVLYLSLVDKRHLKSESIGPHSYTLYDTANIRPESIPENMSIIKKYAGANGLIYKMPTV